MRNSLRPGILLRLCSRAFPPTLGRPGAVPGSDNPGLLLRGNPRVNNSRLLLLLCYVRVHVDLCTSTSFVALLNPFCSRWHLSWLRPPHLLLISRAVQG
jgi:hypothetical protein